MGESMTGPERSDSAPQRRAAVFFVGNKLKLDDGIGPAAYDLFLETYVVGPEVELFDVGCMSLDMIRFVEKCDFILTVDAVDGSGHPAGTVFRFSPDDMARTSGPRDSLHDLKLADLFDAALLLGYECDGWCVGMQVENMVPAELVIGLTPPCNDALPLLVDAAAAELDRRGFPVSRK